MTHPIFRRIITRRTILIIIGLLVFATIIGYIGEAYSISDWLKSFFTGLVGYNQFVAGVVFVVLAMISAMLSFFTSTPLVPIAIALWGKEITFLLLMTGWLVGSLGAYCIGYAAAHLLKRLHLFDRVERYKKQLGSDSGFLLILLFRLAVPSEIGGYTLGLLRYNPGLFLMITLIAEVPFGVLAIYSSTALVGPHPIVFAGLMVIGLLAMSIFVYFFHRRLKQLRGVVLEDESLQ